MPKPSIARWTADIAAVLFAILSAAPAPAAAQDTTTFARVLTSWIAVPATPGYEDQATSRIASATRGFSRDNMGNLVRRVGSGSPRRVIACGIGAFYTAAFALAMQAWIIRSFEIGTTSPQAG